MNKKNSRNGTTPDVAIPLPDPGRAAAATIGTAPFGGFSIDFSNDIGAVPVANAVGPIAFGDELAPASGGPDRKSVV